MSEKIESEKTNHLQKKLVLGITGGIAAYKCADLVRRLKERGFEVRVVMTVSAAKFITPVTLQAVSGYPVHQDLFDAEMEASMGHIELARWADYILVAPATANTISKLVHGKADNLLTTLILASRASLLVAPAMNQQMWANTVTQNNIRVLESSEVIILGPEEGEQACGDLGAGRMMEPVDIANQLLMLVNKRNILANKKVVITAGPTVEAIDPVRYISNHSSGKMGFALARAARLEGAEVELVSGPVALCEPAGVNMTRVTSAAEMLEVVKQKIKNADIFIGCAAVADYTPVEVASQKIKKNQELMNIQLKKNSDILTWVASQEGRPYVVGFAAESQNIKEFARKKLENKKLDLICANDISCQNMGFNSENNQLFLIDCCGVEKQLSVASKIVLAQQVIQEIELRMKTD